eukprot:203117_1
MATNFETLPNGNDNIDSIGTYGTLDAEELTPTQSSNREHNAPTQPAIPISENNGVVAGSGSSTNENSQHTETVQITAPNTVQHIKHSSMKSMTNPLTLAREKKIKDGTPLMVNFDERVVVHTVPYWDPCGETFYDQDDDDGPRGPNCCIVL